MCAPACRTSGSRCSELAVRGRHTHRHATFQLVGPCEVLSYEPVECMVPPPHAGGRQARQHAAAGWDAPKQGWTPCKPLTVITPVNASDVGFDVRERLQTCVKGSPRWEFTPTSVKTDATRFKIASSSFITAWRL